MLVCMILLFYGKVTTSHEVTQMMCNGNVAINITKRESNQNQGSHDLSMVIVYWLYAIPVSDKTKSCACTPPHFYKVWSVQLP